MTKWLPDRSTLRRPVYQSLVEQLSWSIETGRLTAGERLPPHRKLAEQLAISVQTVSRAYEELIRRGLAVGEVGRGTFVRAGRSEPAPPYLPERLGELIDLSILKPVCEAIHVEKAKAALAGLAESLPPSLVLSFRPNMVSARHRAIAVTWLAGCGLETAAKNVIITNGATSAMTVALMTATRPGAAVATEAIGHHTLLPLAGCLGLTLKSLEIDEEGIVPAAFERACREGDLRALYLLPNAANPTAAMMSLARREALLALAERFDVLIVENETWGQLISERPPPFAALAPERTFYFTSFTKSVLPGLRIGYLVVPDRFAHAAANRHLVSNWMATPVMAEWATRWVEDGTAAELVAWQRAALRRRQALAAEIFAGLERRAHPEGLHVWLTLPPGLRDDTFVGLARLHGVAVAPGSSFATTPSEPVGAIRVSVGSTSEPELKAGLETVANLLRGEPEPALLAI